MSNSFEYLANVVLAIKDDPDLKQCFNKVLKFGPATQQIRVSSLIQELEKQNAPMEVKKFAYLLGDDKLAHQILKEINS